MGSTISIDNNRKKEWKSAAVSDVLMMIGTGAETPICKWSLPIASPEIELIALARVCCSGRDNKDKWSFGLLNCKMLCS